MKEIEIKSIVGDVLFTYECEDNTIKKTVEKAVKKGANLQYANLSGTDLSGTDLLETDLSNTDLSTTIISMYSLWSVDHIGSDIIKIGCKVKTVEEWDDWFAGDETFTTYRDTEEFKRIYAHYVGVREYLKIINAA